MESVVSGQLVVSVECLYLSTCTWFYRWSMLNIASRINPSLSFKVIFIERCSIWRKWLCSRSPWLSQYIFCENPLSSIQVRFIVLKVSIPFLLISIDEVCVNRPMMKSIKLWRSINSYMTIHKSRINSNKNKRFRFFNCNFHLLKYF